MYVKHTVNFFGILLEAPYLDKLLKRQINSKSSLLLYKKLLNENILPVLLKELMSVLSMAADTTGIIKELSLAHTDTLMHRLKRTWTGICANTLLIFHHKQRACQLLKVKCIFSLNVLFLLWADIPKNTRTHAHTQVSYCWEGFSTDLTVCNLAIVILLMWWVCVCLALTHTHQ